MQLDYMGVCVEWELRIRFAEPQVVGRRRQDLNLWFIVYVKSSKIRIL